jgi:hypothetical protein
LLALWLLLLLHIPLQRRLKMQKKNASAFLWLARTIAQPVLAPLAQGRPQWIIRAMLGHSFQLAPAPHWNCQKVAPVRWKSLTVTWLAKLV